MNEAHFTLKFEGSAFDNGEIDVHDLAPALLALGDMFQTANELMNQDKTKTSVKVRATSEGSFEVDLTLWQDVISSLLTFSTIHAKDIESANSLADLVLKTGAIVGTPAGGLFLFIKWLKGRKPDQIKDIADGNVSVHVGDNVFITNKKTIILAESVDVRENAHKLVSTLKRDGIDRISCRQGDQEEFLSIEKSDIQSFIVPEIEEEELEESTRKMRLQIISLSFKEQNKWRLTDGSEPFSAIIEDINFLNKIDNNEVSFGKNDYLECNVRERQIMTASGLKMERTIVEVLTHKHAGKQLRLI